MRNYYCVTTEAEDSGDGFHRHWFTNLTGAKRYAKELAEDSATFFSNELTDREQEVWIHRQNFTNILNALNGNGPNYTTIGTYRVVVKIVERDDNYQAKAKVTWKKAKPEYFEEA